MKRYIPTAVLTLAAAALLSACDTSQDDPARNPDMSPPSPPPTDTPLDQPLNTPPPGGTGANGAAGTTPPPFGQANSLAAATNSNSARGSNVQNDQLQELPYAEAEMSPTEGNEVSGTISFLESPNNIAGARIMVQLTGLTPGPHGMHIHQNGDCSAPDASSAGDHFNPHNMPHGGRTAPERHTGDLGNVTANDSGVVEIDIEDSTISFEGEDSILGRAVIVHAGGDDYISQPSGDSGDPVACGVITPTEVSKLPATGQHTVPH